MSQDPEQPDDVLPDTESVEAESVDAEDGDLREFRFKLGKNLTRRLDQYLVDRIGYLSRNEIQRLISDGFVKLNGKPTKASVKPREHDIVEVSAPPKFNETIEGEDIPLEVLYEDDYMMALNKQAGLAVHPARGQWSGTLVNGLVNYGSKWSTLNGNWRPGILHRLDRNTTGVILVAKADEAHWRLSRQFENRTIKKTYVAMCHGIPQLLGDVIDMPIGRDRYVREKQAVRKLEAGGRSAVTAYEVKETLETPAGQAVYRFQKSPFANDSHYRTPGSKFSFIKLFPKTGRTHQLRVHLSHIGYPIIGDTMYGGQIVVSEAEPAFTFARQALHAHEITFTHPVTLDPMTISAPLPPDMVRLWELLSSARVSI